MMRLRSGRVLREDKMMDDSIIDLKERSIPEEKPKKERHSLDLLGAALRDISPDALNESMRSLFLDEDDGIRWNLDSLEQRLGIPGLCPKEKIDIDVDEMKRALILEVREELKVELEAMKTDLRKELKVHRERMYLEFQKQRELYEKMKSCYKTIKSSLSEFRQDQKENDACVANVNDEFKL